jgi:hypothetical protein
LILTMMQSCASARSSGRRAILSVGIKCQVRIRLPATRRRAGRRGRTRLPPNRLEIPVQNGSHGTRRWREMDSKFQYAGTVNLRIPVIASFLCRPLASVGFQRSIRRPRAIGARVRTISRRESGVF